jgi:hypothetical protein
MHAHIPNAVPAFFRLIRNALLILSSMLIASQASAVLTINEIRTASLAGDNDEAFLEIAGTYAETLAGLTYLVIGDSANSSTGTGGIIESVTTFTTEFIDFEGFYIGARSGFVLGTPDSELNFTFEADDNVTHLLVAGFTGNFNQDLDTNDDGVLDVTPWTNVLDAVSIVNKTSADAGFDFYYGSALGFTDVGPSGSPILRIYRNPDGSGPWFIGDAPAGVLDTPGASNVAIPEPGVAWLMGAGLLILLARKWRALRPADGLN